MRIKTKIVILDGELRVRDGGPITEDGKVGKGVTLTVGEDVSATTAKRWVDRGKAEAVAEPAAAKPVRRAPAKRRAKPPAPKAPAAPIKAEAAPGSCPAPDPAPSPKAPEAN